MTTTSTTAPPGRRAEQLIERARKAGGRQQPSNSSDVADINGATISTLGNENGPMARDLLGDDALTGIAVLDADQLHAAAFARPRDPRSAEYKAGVRAALAFRIDATPIIRPYPAASAQDDAFDGGLAEGHAIWRRTQAEATGAA